MKKNKIIYTCIILAAGLFLYAGACKILGYPLLNNNSSKTSKYSRPVITGHEGETLPSIDLLLPDSTSYKDIGSTSQTVPIVLFYFGPDCPYCQAQIGEIINNIDHLKKIQFYLLSPYQLSEVRRFYNTYELKKYKNIIVGYDYKFRFAEYFKTESIPFIAIYGKNKKLKSAFIGSIKSTQIKEVSEN